MKVVCAFDKFRGTLTAPEAVEAAAAGVHDAAPGAEVVRAPVADGGEGFLDALGGPNRTTTVSGPLGDAVSARWRMSPQGAVVEMARASGLELVGGAAGNDPIAATTSGTGELIAEAVVSGARRVLVGLGGSATTDGGLGAVRALEPHARLKGVEIVVACDVATRFVDAAAVFGPQKGATPKHVELLRRRLERLAQMYEEDFGVDVRDIPGTGAAGGLAGGLVAIGARLVGGFELVAEEIGLDEDLEDADLVLTGEGKLDEGSFDGKVVGGVVELAAESGVPVVAVAGTIDPAVRDRIECRSLVDEVGTDRALGDTAAALREVVGRVVAVR